MARWLTLIALLTSAAVRASSPPTPTAPPFTPGPVIEWGRPLEGGPLRVACLLQGAKEEGLELFRRFDFTGDVWVAKGRYGVDSTASSLARRRLAAGEVDVFVVGGIYWNRIPATLRLAILEQVEKGMGLLLVEAPQSARDSTLPKVLAAGSAPEAAAAITRGIPLPLLPLVTVDPERNAYCVYPDAGRPTPSPEQLVTASRFGKGRICVLNYSVAQSNVVYLYSLTPGVRIRNAPFARPYPYWEYCHSLLGKAVRWAGGREPGVDLAVTAGPSGGALASVGLQGPAAAAPVQLEAVVRDRYHTIWGRATSTLAPGVGTPARCEVKLPVEKLPPGGLTFVDVWARREGKVLDWATATVERPAAARLTAVKLDSRRYEAGRPVKAAVQAAGDLRGTTLRVDLAGTDGRLLQRWSGPTRSAADLTFSLAGAQTLVSTLDARLLSGKQTLWRERVPVLLAPGAPRSFFAYSWMDAEAYYTRDYLRRIQDQGVDGVLAGGGAATYFFQGGRMATEASLRLVPTNVVDSRLGKPPGDDPAKLPRPFTDPNVMAEETRRLRTEIPVVADAQPLGYSLMDEWALGWSGSRLTDYGPASMAAFRQWIRGIYPTLEALNAQWGRQYATWDEVTPMQAREVQSNLKQVDGSPLNLSPFVDYRLFMDTVGPTAFADFAKTIRDMDPGAKVGLCGTESNGTWYGYEWYRLSRVLDFICGYGDAAATPNISRAMRGLQRELQRSFRRPGALLSCWVGYHESDFYRDQALKLLLHDFHGIAYFAGNPSIYADFPYLDYDYTLSRRALLAGACTREIRRGLDQLIWNSRRDSSGLAILLSPPSQHVASGLGREGEWGGRVVDLTQAVEDAGLQYDFVAPEQLASGVLKERGYRAVILPQVTCLSEPEAKALGEFAAGGGGVVYDRPPGVLDEHGRSRPQPPQWSGARVIALAEVPDARAARAALLRETLGRVGIAAPVRIEHGEKVDLPVECILYHQGEQLLVSLQTDLVAEGKQPEPMAKITLPSAGFVYDLRQGKALGRTSVVSAPLDPMHILLYAVLPYEVKGVAVSAAPVRRGGETVVNLRVVASGKLSPHFLRVTILGPDGKERPGFATTVRAAEGRGTARLRFALNDPPGRWQVRARDAVTGVTGSAALEVRP